MLKLKVVDTDSLYFSFIIIAYLFNLNKIYFYVFKGISRKNFYCGEICDLIFFYMIIFNVDNAFGGKFHY